MAYHSLENETRAVRQALQPGRMPLGVLLGAGCPLAVRDDANEPLIPDVAGLTAKVVADLAARSETLANNVATVQGHLTDDGRDAANIEHVLSHIRVLRMAAGSDSARGLAGVDLETLDEAICDSIVTHANKGLPGVETPYHRLARWVGGVRRDRAVELFTTNYDLLLEQALEEVGVPYFDGFMGSRRAFFDTGALERPSLSGRTEHPLDELPSRWARLWKLHGSINWYQDDDGVVFRGPVDDVAESRLIYPSHLKYTQSQRMPYLAMFDRLGAFLRQSPCVLITCGYSFRDEHVNAVLEDGLRTNPSSVCFALMFDELTAYDEASEIASRRFNLNLLALDAAVVSGRRGLWEMVGETDGSNRDAGLEVSGEGDEAQAGAEPTRCDLGDFAVLGAFLERILGTSVGADSGG